MTTINCFNGVVIPTNYITGSSRGCCYKGCSCADGCGGGQGGLICDWIAGFGTTSPQQPWFAWQFNGYTHTLEVPYQEATDFPVYNSVMTAAANPNPDCDVYSLDDRFESEEEEF